MNFYDEHAHLDTSLSIEERVMALLSQMTLEEKVAQTLHNSPAIERLQIPEYNWWSECLHGVARAGLATVFPQTIGMAATFHTELLFDVATVVSDEARAKHHEGLRQGNRGQYFGLTYWSPNINIFRDPRWGRGQETYGEDPYLTSRLAVTFIKGLQGVHSTYRKLDATAKHFAVHSGPEALRHEFNAVVSQRDLHETYLPAFKACVKEGKVKAVMGAYNRTNGEPCCASKMLLQELLRGKWRFDGYVVSDCWALRDFHEGHKVTSNPVESAALALERGCDLNCGSMYEYLLATVEHGVISEEYIDISVARLLTTRFELGMFDPEDANPYAQIPADVVNCTAHRTLARQVARESIVLLENDRHLLPLRKNLNSIAVVGPTSYDTKVLQGNYSGISPQMVTILEGIVGKVSPGTKVTHVNGCSLGTNFLIDEEFLRWKIDDADVIIAVMGLSPDLEGEQGDTADAAASDADGDRVEITLPGRQEELLKILHSTGKDVILVLTGGSPIAVNWAQEHLSAILMAWYPGEEGGNAVADVLFGDYNPAGRLPVTFVKSLDQLPPFEDYNMQGRTYRFMDEDPLYPFGYGLSYTSFAYSHLTLSKKTITKNETLAVSVNVKNTGECGGDEVVQLYISNVGVSFPTPIRHLEGFRRIHLKHGEQQTVTFPLKPENFLSYDEDGQPFIHSGKFNISVGGGQPSDPHAGALTTTLTVQQR